MVHLLEEMETYAEEHCIPIMQKDGIEFLLTYIQDHNVKSILEIGTAIGYSAVRMALLDASIHIVTIERDQERYTLAVENIKKAGVEKQITIYLEDAFEVTLSDTFDFIFIDAAKSQYIKFFEKFKDNLEIDGSILSDNLSFHGMVESKEESASRNVRGIVRKLRKYIEFLEENSEFETTFIKTGDGIGISKRREKDNI